MKPKQQRLFQPSLFKQYLKSKLVSLLDSIAGRKLLMIQSAVRIPINLVSQRKSFFFEHDIPQFNGITAFQVVQIDSNFDKIVIFLSPSTQNLKKLRELVTRNIQKNQNRKFYPVFWPKRTMATKQYLQNSKIMQYIQIKDFSFDLLPLDIDLYSLQMNIMRDLYIQDNHLIYSTVAQSIHRLQCVYGKIHNIYGKGTAATPIHLILKSKEKQITIDQHYGDIQSLIIFDRSSDFLTPLLKQITYEGLIDQFFGINGGIVQIPATNLDQSSAPSSQSSNKKQQSLSLNSQKDYIYEQIRILPTNGARANLVSRNKAHEQFVQRARQMKDIGQKGNAVKKINIQKQLLAKHFNLVSLILQNMKTINFHKQLILQQKCILQQQKDLVEYFQNLIPFQIPLQKILRSMCLQSIIDRGISKKFYGRICDDIVMTYGGEHIISLTNLAKIGLFYQQGSRQTYYPFSQIKKQLHLFSQQKINHQNPNDPAYAYGGYCPIFTKLIQATFRGGWKNILKVLKIIPGQFFLPENHKQCRTTSRPAVIVYFVGGVTYGEVATIRLLSKIYKKQIIVATTHMINGETMIQSLLQPPSPYN